MTDTPPDPHNLVPVPPDQDPAGTPSADGLHHRLRSSEALTWALIGAFDAIDGLSQAPLDVLGRLSAAVDRFPGDLGSWADQLTLAWDLARQSTDGDLLELVDDPGCEIDPPDTDDLSTNGGPATCLLQIFHPVRPETEVA